MESICLDALKLSPRKDGIKCQSSTLYLTGRLTPSKCPLTAERLLRSLGTTGKLAGFRCTVYMVERIQEDPEQLQLITKRLYKETGKKFGVSAASVERNLRTLIHFCWSRTDHSFLAHIAERTGEPRLQTANFSTCLPAICEKWVVEKRGGIGLPLFYVDGS